MAPDRLDLNAAETETGASRRRGYAVSARVDRRGSRIVVALSTGLQLAFPARLAEELAGAAPDDLGEIEISPSGLGLNWPRLDADLYVPGLLDGPFGSRGWAAPPPGIRPAAGGRLGRRAGAAR